jgi:hypothetical protein
MPSQAVIHFVGLVVWTMFNPQTQFMSRLALTNTHGTSIAVASMPRVTGAEVYSLPRIGRATEATASPLRSAPGVHRMAHPATGSAAAGLTLAGGTVEAHTAILAFAPCDVQSSTGWEIKRLTDQLLYVELHGDRVTFRGDATKPGANLNDASLLPNMGGALKAEYAETAPAGTSGDAAVFLIPSGMLRTCMAQGTNDEGQSIDGRVDMLLTLNTSHKLTVDAGPKQLVLKKNAAVYAANIPSAWIATVSTGVMTTGSGSLPHYAVYCHMNGTDDDCHAPAGNSCSGAIAEAVSPGDTPSAPAGCHYCEELGMSPGPSHGHSSPDPAEFITAECSNTRYP